MARRRYISTDISTDEKVNSVSNFAKLLYTWSIPHFADNCRITPRNAAEVKWSIVPALKEGPKEVEKAMQELFQAQLWGRDEEGHIFIPAESFYKYQTYINAANHRKTPQITASPSLSPSPSPSPIREEAPTVPEWLDKDLWEKFKDHRKSLKAKMTAHAEQLALKELDILRGAGEDPAAIIEKSIVCGWKGLFSISGRTDGKRKGSQGLDTLKAWGKRSGILDET